MKTKMIQTILLLAMGSMVLYGQPVIHPWQVVDRGGGRSGAGPMVLQASIGQTAIQRMVYIDTGTVLESGYLPGVRLLSGSLLSMYVPVESLWNMISVPLDVDNYYKDALFAGALSPPFAYNNGYRIVDSLRNGVGYWVKFPVTGSILMSGNARTVDTIDLAGKWNMIGMLSYPILASSVVPVPPLTIASPFFGFSNSGGYFSADTLKPAHGYWVKVSANGRLVLQSGTFGADRARAVAKKNKAVSTESAGLAPGTIVFRDAGGRERTVYYSAIGQDPLRYELPPTPPLGIFDVRYSSGRSLEALGEMARKEAPLVISSARYPITVRWDAAGGAKAALVIDGKSLELNGSGTAVITKPALTIGLELSSGVPVRIPKEFSLAQNFPNPFNPSTRIHYDLPVDAHVVLRIYNTLGQEVRTVKDGIETAGYKSVEWNSINGEGLTVASGIYFYRIDATGAAPPVKTFTQVKKMLLIR